MERIYPNVWLESPRIVREQLAKDLHIPKTGMAEVIDQTVVSDGYSIDDLGVINVPLLVEYVGRKESFKELWLAAVRKASEIVGIEVVEEVPVEAPMAMVDEPDEMADLLKDTAKELEGIKTPEKKSPL